ncbi:MAG TPA: TetR/AcrR family transcriptional regulator [Anaerolineales bacterium]
MSTSRRTAASSTNQSNDLRVRRTRKWLQDALIELMKEKSFQDIQITELTARAQVSRPAFYLHFVSKEDLLLSHVGIIFDEFHAEISREIARGNIDRKRFSLMLFQYWERYAETLRMVIQAENPDILLERLKEYVGVIMKEIAAKARKPAIDPRLQELIVGYVAGGAYMLLTQWISNKMPFSAEQMGQLFYDLTDPCENIHLAR